MKIGMILDCNNRGFPPDIRVEKEARALAQAGHQVLVLTRKVQPDEQWEEVIDAAGLTVARVFIPREKHRWQRMLRELRLFDARWIEAIRWFIQQYRIDVLHVHDLLLVPTALYAAKLTRTPVVADLHENMPAAQRAYRSNRPWKQRIVAALTLNYHLMRFHEARALRQCVRTIVVVPEAAERILAYGIDPEHVVVVSNTEDETTFAVDAQTLDTDIIQRYADSWTVTYTGGIGPHRGLDTVLDGLPGVVEQIPKLRILIVGASPWDFNWIQRRAQALGITAIVDVLGWQPFEKINSYIMASRVCLVPHNDFEHTQTTVPHKLFQYMICAKPVLVSDCAPLKRIVEQAQCGCVFTASNRQAFQERLIWMYHHQDQLTIMGEQGRHAALNRYAWRHDARTLVNLYERLKLAHTFVSN